MQDSLDAAQEVIDALLEKGFDYSAHKIQIARELFDEGIFEGILSVYTKFEDPKLEDLRAIQEDEYDQHMEDGEKPSWGSMVCHVHVAGAYVWFAYS